MEQKKETSDVLRELGFLLVVIIIISLVTFIITNIPYFYDKLYGDKIINNWLEENLENISDFREITTITNLWIKNNVHYPSKEEYKGFFIYRINNETVFWPRNAKFISWTITKKLGRCGEDAYFFVNIMNLKGYRARVIKAKGWDHAWAEFYPFNDSYKIIVDPSNNKIITDLKAQGAKHNWTEIYAIDLYGNKEELSEEYR